MKKIKKNKTNISISMIIYIIISVFIGYLIYKINILPAKYLVASFVGLIFSNIILLTLNLKRKNRVANVFYYIFLLIFIGGIGFGAYGIKKFNNIFKEISKKDRIVNEYYLITTDKNLEYSEEKEEEVGYFKFSSNNILAFHELSKKTKYKKKEYSNLEKMIGNILNIELKISLLSRGEYDFLVDTIPNFKEKTKIIHKFNVETKVKNDPEKDLKAPFILYIAGIDTRSGKNVNSLTDVNILATINPKTHDILLTNIPRDTYVRLHGTNENDLKDKLTHAGIYGIDMSKNTIEDLLNIKINNFIRINFEGFSKAIDLIGGITINNLQAFKNGLYYFPKGQINLNGDKALHFSRERKQLAEGDYDRGRNQQKIVAAVLEKIQNNPALLTKADNIILEISKYLYTDISEEMIKYYLKEQINNMPKWNIYFDDLKVTESFGPTYSIPNNKNQYISIIDEKSLEKVKNKINKVLNK